MEESKSISIGLSWAPDFSSLMGFGTKASDEDASVVLEKISEPELVDGLFVPPRDPKQLNKMIRKQMKDTSGKSWFDMPATAITPEIKKDLQLLKLRNVIDPKRHYKKGDSKALPKYFQVGTVVESASDFFSGRMTKRERKATLAEELLSDANLTKYRKRKVREIEEKHRPAEVQKWKIKGRRSQKRAKQRRH